MMVIRILSSSFFDVSKPREHWDGGMLYEDKRHADRLIF